MADVIFARCEKVAVWSSAQDTMFRRCLSVCACVHVPWSLSGVYLTRGVVAVLGILLKQETVSGSGISWAIIDAYILQCTL